MSLIASDKGNGTHFEIIPEDTYTAICCEVIDLGLQENKTYDKVQPKVLIGWEIPELQVEIGGEMKPRIYTKQYTNSLNDKATLCKHLLQCFGLGNGAGKTVEDNTFAGAKGIVGSCKDVYH